jgi:FKBP-type peptidyl-prolyl cis-trans isomerase (trigger factor)
MSVTKEDLDKLKKELKDHFRKELSDKIESEVKKQLKSNAHDKRIKEVTQEVLTKLFRVLWNRSSFWKTGL